MVNNLNGVGLGSLSSGYMNTASQIAQQEAGSLFASLLPAGSASASATSDSATFSLASIAALADAGMVADANANGSTSAATSGAATASSTQASPTSSVIPTVLDSFAGLTPQPLVSLPSPVAPATGGSAINQTA